MAVIDKGVGTTQATVVAAGTIGALLTTAPGNTSAGVEVGGGSGNAPDAAAFSEIDPGTVTAARLVASAEVDADFRFRDGVDTMLDTELFVYTAQNTGKHNYITTTMTATWSAAGLTTNGSSITTTTTGARVRTYASFSLYETCTLYYETIASFSAAACPANTLVSMGGFIESGATPFAPTDGAYFEVTSAGFAGIVMTNSTPTSTGVLAFVPVVNQKYKFVVSISFNQVRFWIDDVLYGTVARPSTVATPFFNTALPWAIRHAIAGGAAGGVYQVVVGAYNVSMGGAMSTDTLEAIGNRLLGSHQGLSGGTMGSLANYANSGSPVAGAGSNTATIMTGLGGQVGLNAGAGGGGDLILCSYQVPQGSVLIQNRRLVVKGVRIMSVNTVVAVTTTATIIALSLAFGHTAVSMATVEAATAKAPRREALGFQSWLLNDGIGQPARDGAIYMPFLAPLIVNPGEFIAIVTKFNVGTATATEVFQFHVTFDYGWI
jgi:hypothetical protein